MTEKSYCTDHPNAPAIENCANCAKFLCGMCANFTEEDVLCEECVKIREEEKFVAIQTQQFEQAEKAAAVETVEEVPQQHHKAKKISRTQWQMAITLLCVGIVAAQQFFSSSDEFVPLSAEEVASLNAVTSLDNCVQIFRQIGAGLQNNRMPDESQNCDESGVSHIITRTGNDIQVALAHPDFYGLSQLYVSRDNPEPTLVE